MRNQAYLLNKCYGSPSLWGVREVYSKCGDQHPSGRCIMYGRVVDRIPWCHVCWAARSYSITVVVRAFSDMNVMDTKVPCTKSSHLQKVSMNEIVSRSARCELSFCAKQCYPLDNSKVAPLYLKLALTRKQFSLGPF